jgi:hypothetical protein
MATWWEIHDGQRQMGPLEEEHVLRMIAAGLPAAAMVRPAGEDIWKNVRAHAPFAIAIDARGASPAAAPIQTGVAVARPQGSRIPAIAVGAGLGLSFLMVGVAVLIAVGSKRSPDPTLTASSPPAVQSTPPVAPQPLAAVVKGSNGGWAVIKRPADTGDARVNYMREVLAAAPGEPKIDTKAAAVLLDKLRFAIAKEVSVPAASIKPTVGESSGSLVVSAGVFARMSVHGENRNYPVCSEAFLGTGMVQAGIEPSDFAKVGMRGLMCKSDGCSAIFDMRPTSVGGGVYGGASCLSFQDMMKMGSE